MRIETQSCAEFSNPSRTLSDNRRKSQVSNRIGSLITPAKYLPILSICIWLLAESSCRLAADSGPMELCALIISRLIWIGVAITAVMGSGKALGVFAAMCVASIITVIPDIPAQYEISTISFWFSVVGCLFKATFLASITFEYLNRPGNAVSG